MAVNTATQNKGIVTEIMVKHKHMANVRVMKYNSMARMGLSLEGTIYIISLLMGSAVYSHPI
jgi:hypothetical protein